MRTLLPILALAYLLGSIPFGYLLVRVFRKQDIRAQGSGNIGATNVARAGKGLGIATLLLDAAKGFAAVAIAQHCFPGDADAAALTALAAVLGHVFPVWLRFRGGKGVATALGVFLAISWPTAVAALAVFVVVVGFSRYVSLASILGAATLPVFLYYFKPVHTPIFLGCAIGMAILVIAKHHANIGRLSRGEESKFGADKVKPAAETSL